MHRRRALLVLTFFALLVPFAHGEKNHSNGSYLVYVGTYTGPESKGIYVLHFDSASGKLTSEGLALKRS